MFAGKNSKNVSLRETYVRLRRRVKPSGNLKKRIKNASGKKNNDNGDEDGGGNDGGGDGGGGGGGGGDGGGIVAKSYNHGVSGEKNKEGNYFFYITGKNTTIRLQFSMPFVVVIDITSSGSGYKWH